jgi:hypothetical protein
MMLMRTNKQKENRLPLKSACHALQSLFTVAIYWDKSAVSFRQHTAPFATFIL